MAETDCTVCPELLTRLGAAAGGMRALADLIDREIAEPTQAWRDLLPALAMRARNLAAQAEGRH
ncbi:hypothetical protein [Verrucosispora sp. WMMD1129]|uniref:hypothetical protein n=1 Tax=Verrucosispora sp. WMMD1129 TaxID=3016093 RepID=UPI00249C5B14|nr:hypothetical protein [Verrucosispora sp. WMMD1129]WFE45000.1 hypothetical protein O7624_11955 [Verrucosispora sp. WMMD1129]WFE46290.1 hypothetical protein O7624_19030 [Verrucosispora sp. WMMD1129]